MEQIQLAVRQLIEFVMRSGDIDSGYRSSRRMVEGIKAHQRIQKAYGPGYNKEVVFRHSLVLEDIRFDLEGRADGVFEAGDRVIIDEIKSTTRPLEDLDPGAYPLHWAQAKCYACMYCLQHDRSDIEVQLTYVNLDEEVLSRKFIQSFSRDDLEIFLKDLLRRYLDFSRALIAWQKKRDESIRRLRFPYPSYREGQRKMSVAIYQAIEEERRLFVEAPTGIGKTMSAVVPAISSIAALGVRKIFYLTARTTLQREAKKAVEVLTEKGLALKAVQITAKERICINEEVSCNPEDCPYAKGHFDRVNDAILDLFHREDLLSRELIVEYAEKHRVCPHEFQLDMSDFSDFVLCDYNYVFDPRVYLRRAFDEDNPATVLLVDEAHNLVDRGRDMYTADFRRSQIERLVDVFPKDRSPKLFRLLQKVLRRLEDLLRAVKEGPPLLSDEREEADYSDSKVLVKKGPAIDWPSVLQRKREGGFFKMASRQSPDSLYFDLKGILTALDPFLSKEKEDPDYEEVLAMSFDLSAFTRIYELWQDGFVSLITEEEEDLVFRIQCVDTGDLFQNLLTKVRSAVFFSATLSPTPFYQDLLGGGPGALALHLDSPFPAENLRILQINYSTRYKDRPLTLGAIAEAVHYFLHSRAGNYMIFFPSYAYLDLFQARYRETYDDDLIIQGRFLTDSERKEILKAYEDRQGVKGFFVLGGLFSEGIDLSGEKLIGCGIVSVGLPGLSFERDVIRQFFDEKSGLGFDYAYTYPGMNKILQAGGRVIRTATDKGTILLLDDRFSTSRYRILMPKHWQQMETISPRQLAQYRQE